MDAAVQQDTPEASGRGKKKRDDAEALRTEITGIKEAVFTVRTDIDSQNPHHGPIKFPMKQLWSDRLTAVMQRLDGLLEKLE